MRIEKINNNEANHYDELAHNYGTIFNTTNWLRIFNNSVQIYGIYDKGGHLIGGFHLYKEKKWGFTICWDAPFTPGCGPFLRVVAQNPVAIMDTWKRALTSMSEFIEDLHYSLFSFSLNKNILDAQPFIWLKNKVVPRYTYVLDLARSLDDIKKDMSVERRNDINKGIKDGLISQKTNDYQLVKSLIVKTFQRQNKKFNEFYLDKILFKFGNKENSFAFMSFKSDTPIAASLCVYDKDTAYYLLGGYDSENRHHGAGAISLWECIKYAKELGLKYFDFEGSMVPNIEKYFRGFGGKLTPYYRINKAKLPIEMILKLFKRELF